MQFTSQQARLLLRQAVQATMQQQLESRLNQNGLSIRDHEIQIEPQSGQKDVVIEYQTAEELLNDLRFPEGTTDTNHFSMKRESVETLVGSGRVTPTVQTVTDQVPNEITKPVAVQPTQRPTIIVSTSRSPSPTTPTVATASASASGPHQPTLAFEKLQIHQDSPSPSMPGPDSPLPSPTSSPKPRIKKTQDARPREFHCEICNGRFLRRQDLRRHEVTHSKSREFYCPFECGSSFGRSDALARHLKTSKCSLKATH